MNVIHTPTTLVSYLVWNSSKGLQKEMDLTLHHFDLTYVQFLILLSINTLNTDQKFVSQTHISNYLSTDKNIVSQCLKRLAIKKLIRKMNNPTDGRSKIVILTDLGVRRLEQTTKLILLKDNIYLKTKLSQGSNFEQQMKILGAYN